MPSTRLTTKVLFTGTITALTGLHIGGSEVGLQIGGADKIVVRNPRDNTPYIPGSSLKGKMRSLLERVYCASSCGGGFVYAQGNKTQHGPCRCAECDVCRVFGVAIDDNAQKIRAGRLLVRDAMMANAATVKNMPNLLTDYTELKTEVSIDRLTSAANPRNFERVPAGAEFAFHLMLNVFADDDAAKLVALIEEGLRLVAYDALGGQSSRGYGRIEIKLTQRTEIPIAAFTSNDELNKALASNQLDKPLIWSDLGKLEEQPKAA